MSNDVYVWKCSAQRQSQPTGRGRTSCEHEWQKKRLPASMTNTWQTSPVLPLLPQRRAGDQCSVQVFDNFPTVLQYITQTQTYSTGEPRSSSSTKLKHTPANGGTSRSTQHKRVDCRVTLTKSQPSCHFADVVAVSWALAFDSRLGCHRTSAAAAHVGRRLPVCELWRTCTWTCRDVDRSCGSSVEACFLLAVVHTTPFLYLFWTKST